MWVLQANVLAVLFSLSVVFFQNVPVGGLAGGEDMKRRDVW